MCLERLVNEKPITVGYKVFSRYENGMVYPWLYGFPMKVGKWYRSRSLFDRPFKNKCFGECRSSKESYELGFHVYHSLEDANSWATPNEILTKVQVKNPICVGHQRNGWLVTVARKIKVLEIINRKNMFNINNKTHCPICQEDLYDFGYGLPIPYPKTYCPKCNIYKTHWMSAPYLCSECYSLEFYITDDKEDVCWYCGNTKFISMSSDEFRKVEDIISQKEGYKLSEVRLKLGNGTDCKHNNISKTVQDNTILKLTCDDCGYTVYFKEFK